MTTTTLTVTSSLSSSISAPTGGYCDAVFACDACKATLASWDAGGPTPWFDWCRARRLQAILVTHGAHGTSPEVLQALDEEMGPRG